MRKKLRKMLNSIKTLRTNKAKLTRKSSLRMTQMMNLEMRKIRNIKPKIRKVRKREQTLILTLTIWRDQRKLLSMI
jgi:hypothetical protein